MKPDDRGVSGSGSGQSPREAASATVGTLVSKTASLRF
jgi:hypothetical protein